MIIIQDKLVSDALVTEQFACNLGACKGACCWEGDAGAPLEAEELPVLDQLYPLIRPYLSPAGIAAIEQQGCYTRFEGEWGTTLIDGGPCAYMTLAPGGVAQCGIEMAWKAGAVDFQKPISCHLYPVRVLKNEPQGFEALNYDEWSICSAACHRGASERIRVFEFVREALIRRYGEAFYEALEAAAEALKE
jgi:hypothetical protein